MKIVWSEHCGKCGEKKSAYLGFIGKRYDYTHKQENKCLFLKDFPPISHGGHHVFVRVPLNFDEWRKELAKTKFSEVYSDHQAKEYQDWLDEQKRQEIKAKKQHGDTIDKKTGKRIVDLWLEEWESEHPEPQPDCIYFEEFKEFVKSLLEGMKK